MAVEAYLPTLTTVAVTAAIDSINPCAIGVLILMVSVLLATHQKGWKVLLYGSLYIFSVFAVYLLAGLGLMYFLTKFPLIVTEYISLSVGSLIIIAGLIEVKDFFWYGKGFSLTIPPIFARRLHGFASRTTIPGVMLLGAFVSGVELPCTGAPYLAIITLLSQYFDFTAFLMLLLYNIIFVMPLIVILILVVLGRKLYEIKKWKQNNRHFMRLFIGLVLILMGWFLMLIANGTINLG